MNKSIVEADEPTNEPKAQPIIQWVNLFEQKGSEAASPVELISKKLNIPNTILKTVSNRGNNTEEINKFFQYKLGDISPPSSISGVSKAVERLIEARELNEKICIYGDFDLDGTPGIALLTRALEDLGFDEVVYFQPNRFNDGYGFHKHVVEKLVEIEVSVIITVDVGITAIDTIDFCNNNCVDVILTDHHLPKDKLPEAYSIVNPNSGVCGSKLQHLCGTGVAFYLMMALRSKMIDLKIIAPDIINPKEWLDCFAIATITDMVPLVSENRILIKHGLVSLQKSRSAGLRVLIRKLDLENRTLNSQDIAMKIAPTLNALGRLNSNVTALDIFLCDSEEEANDLVDTAIEVNKERKAIQKNAYALVLTQGKVHKFKNFIWDFSTEFNQGIVGLIATNLVREFNKCSFIGAVRDGTRIVGSSRCPEEVDVNLVEALGYCKEYLTHFGGHKKAAGFELELKNEQKFSKCLSEYFLNKEISNKETIDVKYDCEISLGDLDSNFLEWYKFLDPFGFKFEMPVYRIKKVVILDATMMKEEHLKCEIVDGNFKKKAVWFFVPKTHFILNSLGDSPVVDVLVQPQWNFFRGRESLQLLIIGVKKTE